MTKDELKATITGLDLDKDMERAILQMVNDSDEITPQLLEAVADILEDQAAADELDILAAKVEGIRDDYLEGREEISADLSDLLSDDLTAVVDKVNHHVALTGNPA